MNTATAIDALRKAIRDYPTDDNNNIITKFDPSISADARKIITDAIAAATPGDLDPRNVLNNLKSKILLLWLVGVVLLVVIVAALLVIIVAALLVMIVAALHVIVVGKDLDNIFFKQYVLNT